LYCSQVMGATTSGPINGFGSSGFGNTLVVTDETGGLTEKELQKRFNNVGHVLVSYTIDIWSLLLIYTTVLFTIITTFSCLAWSFGIIIISTPLYVTGFYIFKHSLNVKLCLLKRNITAFEQVGVVFLILEERRSTWRPWGHCCVRQPSWCRPSPAADQRYVAANRYFALNIIMMMCWCCIVVTGILAKLRICWMRGNERSFKGILIFLKSLLQTILYNVQNY